MNPPLFQSAPLEQLQKTARDSNDRSTLEALKAELGQRRAAIDRTASTLDESAAEREQLRQIIELERQVETKLNQPIGTTDVPAPSPRLTGKAGEVQGFFDKLTQNPATQGMWGMVKTVGEWIHGAAVWFGEMWKTTIGPTLTRMKDGLKTWLNGMGSGFVTGASSVLGFLGFNTAAETLQRFATGESPPATTPETLQAEDLRKKIENLFPAGVKITTPTARDVTRFRATYDRMRMIRAKGIKDKVSVLENEYPDTVYITTVRDYLRTKEPQATEFTLAKIVDAAEEFNQKEDSKAPPVQPAGTGTLPAP